MRDGHLPIVGSWFEQGDYGQLVQELLRRLCARGPLESLDEGHAKAVRHRQGSQAGGTKRAT